MYNMTIIFVSYLPNRLSFLRTLAFITVVPTTLNNCFTNFNRIHFVCFLVRTSEDLKSKLGRISITMF